jgi:hypothetical protein
MPMVLAMNIDLVTRQISFGAPSTQWWTQLATAGGLAFATLLTLVLTPCLLVLGGGGELRKYEWDEEKRRTNLFKHGLDFIVADRVLANPYRLDIESQRNDEVRIQSFA